MRLSNYKLPVHPGVSVITCTNRPEFMNRLFRNYDRQRWRNKELIIILNRDSMNMQDYRKKAHHSQNVEIYRLPEKWSLGKCLNYAIRKAKYEFVAKFDDDDLYSPYYLKESIQAIVKKNADIAGKPTYYTFLSGKKQLILRYPHIKGKSVKRISGATLVARKNVFDRVKFESISVAEVTRFIKSCRAKGLKLASTGRYNFAAIRRKNLDSHTWKITESQLMGRKCQMIGPATNIMKFITKDRRLH